MALVTFFLLALSSPPERHVIYLHGRIVQTQQSERPKSDDYGYYELEAIREAFRKRGFVVHSTIRPKATTVSSGADDVVRQVNALIASGVPADRITVVGASMGAAITFVASERLANPQVRFAVMGTCLASHEEKVVGKILAIREATDETSSPCKADSREIVINTGLNHGFLYRPLPEWVEPVVEFASR